MQFSLFGYQLTKPSASSDKNRLDKITSPIPDGAADYEAIDSIGANTYAFDFDIQIQKESELVQSYRDAARLADVDVAINDIVNEAIVVEDETPVIALTFNEKTGFSENIQRKIIDEFNNLLNLMDFNVNGPQMFRQWFIDGKHYYHKVIKTDRPQDGIQELDWLDPKRIKKVRENIYKKDPATGIDRVVETKIFYVYDPNPNQTQIHGSISQKQKLKLMEDTVVYTHSGEIDHETGRALSHLHKALKLANQLNLVEDSIVVARLSRAPQRRVFYIDVGNLPKSKAEQYMTSLINKYKNRLAYDVTTGTVKANKHHMSMLEDIWLPRKEGGKGTEVSTLDGQAGLSDIDDIIYIRRKLYTALNLPISRMDSEQTFVLGNSGEISRDEIKFTKFVSKLRNRFNDFFLDLLKTQLILTKKITETDWNNERGNFQFIYNVDSHFAELKKTEIMASRLESLSSVDDYIGRYFSIAWVQREILHMSKEQIKDMAKEIEDEQTDGQDKLDPAFGGIGIIGSEDPNAAPEPDPAPEPAAPDKTGTKQ